MTLQFSDAAALSGTRITTDGYLVGHIRCARMGCQDYMASDLGMQGIGVVSVYRPEEVVFDKASMESFFGKPITVGHPAENVTAENWKALSVGDIAGDIARDGEFIKVSVKVMDSAAIALIQGGTREVSMGYSTGIEMRDGVAPDGTKYSAVQVGPIRINHLAIVPSARGGNKLRIGDAADHWGASPITTSTERVDMTDALKTVVLGDKAAQVALADAPIIEQFKADSLKALADAATAHDKDMAAKDAELATKDAKIADLTKAQMSDADLDKRVADRADLLARVEKVAPGTVIAGLSDAAMKKAAVIKVRGAAMADKSDAYIDAAFDLLDETAAKADPVATVVIDGKLTDRNAIYAARDANLESAWMTTTEGNA